MFSVHVNIITTTSVRLACLMCAASVYPEPGSNSLVIVFIFKMYFYININLFLQIRFNLFRVFDSLILKFTFGNTSITAWSLKGFYCLFFNVLVPSCWNFSIILFLKTDVNTFFDFFYFFCKIKNQ